MITREKLKDYAKIRSLNLGQAEKDYFQNVLLFILYQHYGKTLIFKSGTALNKCYGSRRFSEDLDFTSSKEFDILVIERGLKRFKVDFEITSRKYGVGLKVVLRLKGPLYTGARYSLCKLVIDVSFREKVLLTPVVKTLGSFMEEIPEFDVFVMHQKEILAEKIRTILTRTRARDVYDLWFLLKRHVSVDLDLVEEKLKFYNLHWDKNKFLVAIERVSSIWENELKTSVKLLPPFDTVLNEIKREINDVLRIDGPL